MNTQQILDSLNAHNRNTLMEVLGIEYTEVDENSLTATMPVDSRVHQPLGILHGGATAALAESVGSAASALKLDLETQSAVGLELAINHLRSMREGQVTATARAVHIGRRTHLWQIEIHDQDQRLIAQAKLTMIILARNNSA